MNTEPNNQSSLTSTADRELIDRFTRRHEEDAFRELVHRYAKLVLGVSMRALGNAHEAEDAFQDTFLTLFHKADSLWVRRSIGSWLYGVAYRTARRRAAKRKRRREEPLGEELSSEGDVLMQICARHEQLAFDEELASLPAKYRRPIVLYFLLGKTVREVADQLGISVRSVDGRLRRGKQHLRVALSRRGLSLIAAASVVLSSQESMKNERVGELVDSTVATPSSLRVGGSTDVKLFGWFPSKKRVAMVRFVSLSIPGLVLVLFLAGAISDQSHQEADADENAITLAIPPVKHATETAFTTAGAGTIEKVVKAWRDREEVLRSAEFRWVERHHKTPRAYRGPNGETPGFESSRSAHYVANAELVIDNQRMRYDAPDEPVLVGGTGRFVRRSISSSFDGDVAKTFFAATHATPPQGIIGGEKIMFATEFSSIKPLMVAFRGLNRGLAGFEISNFRSTGHTENVRGIECTVVELLPRRLWVCPERDYVVMRSAVVRRTTGTIKQQTDVSYKHDTKFGWVPTSWVVHLLDKGGNSKSLLEAIVKEHVINAKVDRSRFKLSFPQGTGVVDESAEIEYVVTDDG